MLFENLFYIFIILFLEKDLFSHSKIKVLQIPKVLPNGVLPICVKKNNTESESINLKFYPFQRKLYNLNGTSISI